MKSVPTFFDVKSRCGDRNRFCKIAPYEGGGQLVDTSCKCLDGIPLKQRIMIEKTLHNLRTEIRQLEDKLELEKADNIMLAKTIREEVEKRG